MDEPSDSFRRTVTVMPLSRTDLVAIVALLVLVWVRWPHLLVWPRVVWDEDIYIAAFRATASGESPFGVAGYFYPAALAHVGGWLLSMVGEAPVRYLLRAGVSLGLVVAVWSSLSLWRASAWLRLGVAGVYLATAPVVRSGLENGNLSFAVVGLVVLALFLWPSRPATAGLLLGASVAIKQLALLAIVSLLVHRPAAGGRRHWMAGGIAAAVAVPLLLSGPRLEMMSAARLEALAGLTSASLVRVLGLSGLVVSPVVIALLVAVAVLVVCRLRPLTEVELLCVATTAAVLSLPVVWSHTYLLTLPVQVVAILYAFDGRSIRSPRASARFERPLVLLLVGAAQLAIGREGALGNQPALLQVVILLVPVFAPLLLTIFILHRGEAADA